jgi:hypothetical protein
MRQLQLPRFGHLSEGLWAKLICSGPPTTFAKNNLKLLIGDVVKIFDGCIYCQAVLEFAPFAMLYTKI